MSSSAAWRKHADDLIALLTSVGADVASFVGARMFRCPMCSDQRKKKNLRCLSVQSDGDAFVFHCHHCGWKGGSRARRSFQQRASRTPLHYDQQDKSEIALRIWHESVEPRGTIVDDYLASRGLSLPDEIADDVLRYNGALFFDGRRVRGMVALLRDIADDRPCGIIRTFFDERGDKIERRMFGRMRGAAVKLDADAHVGEGLHVCEGVETGIAGWLAGYRPVWVLGSAVGIAKFPVLAGIEALTILTERNDGDANARAVTEVAAHWQNAGCDVLTVEMLVGDDLNDAWKAVTL